MVQLVGRVLKLADLVVIGLNGALGHLLQLLIPELQESPGKGVQAIHGLRSA